MSMLLQKVIIKRLKKYLEIINELYISLKFNWKSEGLRNTIRLTITAGYLPVIKNREMEAVYVLNIEVVCAPKVGPQAKGSKLT